VLAQEREGAGVTPSWPWRPGLSTTTSGSCTTTSATSDGWTPTRPGLISDLDKEHYCAPESTKTSA
jgi:hypothetical protein